MPELPEVETVRRGLKDLIVSRKILSVEIYSPKSFQGSDNDRSVFLNDAEITNVRRRAKVLIIDFTTNYSLVIHLKMTGQLVFRSPTEYFGAGHPTDSLIGKLPDKSTRVQLNFTDGSHLFFNDQRKFGWVKLLSTIEVENIDFMKKVGPEPLSGDRNLPKQFLTNIRRHNNTTIKAAILNQQVIAGIGNIYADESLWCARIHPSKRVRGLSDSKLREILKCAIDVMQKSIDSGGSTMQSYIKADGSRGDYLEKFANVFRREGQPCPRCGASIEKIRVAGRGTHICPECQREPK